MIHLPWYFYPSTACSDCLKSEGDGDTLRRFHRNFGHGVISGESLLQAWFLLMNGVFLFIMRELCLDSFTDLLAYAQTLEMSPSSIRFSEEECMFLREYDRRAGLEPLANEGYMVFPPVRIIAMSNYFVMTRLLSKLSEETRKAFVRLQRYAQIDGTEPPKGYPIMRLGIIDSHFHLDRLPTHHLIRSSGGLKSMMTKSVNLIYGIANYVYTDSWNKIDRQTQSPKVKYTIGIHPHRIMPNLALSLFNKLKNKLAQNPEAVGIGEVGLDGTTDCRCAVNHNSVNCISRKREEQHRFLELVFRFAKQHEDKVLVIHARDDEEGTYKAASKIYDLIKRCDLCNARIHRHCFVGKEKEFRDWRDTFPNCYFSLSNKSLREIGTETWLLLRDNIDHVILETDAPYFAQKEPAAVYDIAVGVADKIGMEVEELVRVCNRNATRLYNLVW